MDTPYKLLLLKNRSTKDYFVHSLAFPIAVADICGQEECDRRGPDWIYTQLRPGDYLQKDAIAAALN